MKYGYAEAYYAQDPVFDPDSPLHLTPEDNARHEVDVSWRYLGESFAVAIRSELWHRADRFFLARDAGTGLTHYATLPNPNQRMVGAEPSLELEWRPARPVELSLRYGLELVDDRFDGYYSYTGHHPRARVVFTLGERVKAGLSAEAWLRHYGARSYAADPPSHPALTSGDRRADDRGQLGADLGVRVAGGLSARAEGKWTRRRTNFPPYVAGEFPATRSYDIEWSYDNWLVRAGLEYRW